MKISEERIRIKGKQRDFSLDLLRAAACIMVMGVHLGQHISIPGAIAAFFEKGSTGVGFFFILSGYLAYSSIERELEAGRKKKRAVLNFWIRRAVHILPLYYIVILFYFIFSGITGSAPADPTGLYWVRYIFLLNRWVPVEVDFWSNLGAVWTISVFVCFYLIAPFYYMAVRNYFAACFGTVAAFVLFKVTEDTAFETVPVRYMFYFFLGILVYLAIKQGRAAVTAALAAGILIFCFLTGKGEMLCPPLLASLYILATNEKTFGGTETGIFRRLVTGISVISYSLYLDHALVVFVLDYCGVKNEMAYLLIFITSSVALALTTYSLIEVKLARALLEKVRKYG